MPRATGRRDPAGDHHASIGPIAWQSGWTGERGVVPYAPPDKNLECSGVNGLQNGQNAMHTFYTPRGRNYHVGKHCTARTKF